MERRSWFPSAASDTTICRTSIATGSSASVGSFRINSSHPLRQLSDFTFRRKFRPLQKMGFESVVPAWKEQSCEVNDLADAHVVVQPLIFRNKATFWRIKRLARSLSKWNSRSKSYCEIRNPVRGRAI